MKPFCFSFIIFILLGLNACKEATSAAANLFANNDTATFIFPAPLGTVSDFENILTGEQIRSLDSIIIRYEKKTKNRISIVTTQSIRPYANLHDYCTDLHDSWKKEEEKNNSVIILFSEKLNETTASIGSNLKKKLTDKDFKRILKKNMKREFEKGECYSGLKNGLEEIIEEIQ